MNYPASQKGEAGRIIWARVSAAFVDQVLLAPFFVIALKCQEQAGSVALFVGATILPFAMRAAYHFAALIAGGKTVGKELFGIAVCSSDGARIGAKQAALRMLPAVALYFIFIAAILSDPYSAMAAARDIDQYDKPSAAIAVAALLACLWVSGSVLACALSDGARSLDDRLSGTAVRGGPLQTLD